MRCENGRSLRIAQSIYFQCQIVESVRGDYPGNLQIPQQPAERTPRRVINSDAWAKEQSTFSLQQTAPFFIATWFHLSSGIIGQQPAHHFHERTGGTIVQ